MFKKLLLTVALGLGLSTVAFSQEGVKAEAETKVEATSATKKSCCASKTASKTSCSKAEAKKIMFG